MKNLFIETLSKRVLVFDGAMGTNIQSQNLNAADFGGKEGCNEYLVITKPEAIEKVHESFLSVGCDAVETDTFGSNRIVLSEYGLSGRTAELNRKAAALARRCADKYSTPQKPRFVIGSVGPTQKLPTLGHISFNEMHSAFTEQIEELLKGGVDAVLIETCQDILQTKIAVIAAAQIIKRSGARVPLMVQVTMEPNGSMLLGTEIASALTTLEMFEIDAIGLNCSTGPKEMTENVRYLSEHSSKFISVLPNAGLPENVGGHARYPLTPKELAESLKRFARDFGVNIVGGCCGTTPEHLAEVVKKVEALSPVKRKISSESSASSLYESVSYKQSPPPLLVGERTNANGSKKFRELLEKEDYDMIAAMGRESEKEGSHMLDVCCACVGRDETKDMIEVISRLNRQVKTPLMIDSTEAQVLEEALKIIGGKPVINSINLEEGEERLEKICLIAKKYGASLIALTIDEKGMAKDCKRKVEIAERIHKLAVEKHGIRSEDIFFDMLTFTLGSGDASLKNAGIETLEAIRAIKKKFPEAHTILGVSNISFGLEPQSRHVLNSVFLHYAIEAGLDAAIVHSAKIMPLFKIEEEARELARKLIFNESSLNKDPLHAFIEYFQKMKGGEKKDAVKSRPASLEESLKNKIIEGNRANLEKELDEALKKYRPLEIINTILMEGMNRVGELFGCGKMQLPFVLQSADVMKHAVNYLEPLMKKTAASKKGKILIATVKGDVHDIGKNLVDIIMENNGYEVIDIGIKQPIDSILSAAKEHKVDAIGLSGLLVKSTLIMKEYLEEMNTRGWDLPVICGGAALTKKYVEDTLSKVYRGKVFYSGDAFTMLKIMEELKGTPPKSAA